MVADIAIQKKKKEIASKKYTLEEYFKLEELANFKSEFINGKIIPIAGGTINHGKLSGAFYGLLFMLFFNSEEEIDVFSNDQRVYISEYTRSVYSDTCVVVGQTTTYKGGNQAITNPTLIVEVTSKSTEKYDRTTKFRMYQSLPSFKEYVIVSQTMPIVEVFHKISDKKWQMTTYVGLEEVVKLDTLGVELKMSDIYKKVEGLKDPQTFLELPEEEEKIS